MRRYVIALFLSMLIVAYTWASVLIVEAIRPPDVPISLAVLVVWIGAPLTVFACWAVTTIILSAADTIDKWIDGRANLPDHD